MKSYIVSHNACNVNNWSFRLCRSRNSSRYWVIAELLNGCRSYQSISTDSCSLCLSNLASLIHFLGGKLDHTSFVDDVDMLEHLFSDVAFAGGITE